MMLKTLALLIGLSAPAAAAVTVPVPFGVVQSTVTGRAVVYVQGYEKIAASSTTASTFTIVLDGVAGSVQASSITLVYGVKAGSVAVTGSAGFITGQSSITTTGGFFGYGGWLTGVPSTASISGIYAPLAGATFTGASGITNAAFTATGPSGNIVSGASVTASAFFGNIGATTGNAATATTATNLAGGGVGQIPYQSASGTTLFLPAMADAGFVMGNGTSSNPSTGTVVAGTGISVAKVGSVFTITNTIPPGTGDAVLAGTQTFSGGNYFVGPSTIGVSGTDLSKAWKTWTPTWGGFSSDPTGTGTYVVIGKTVIVRYTSSGNGTSNTTAFTMTLPVAAKYDGNTGVYGVASDNGAISAGMIYTVAASTTLNLYYGLGGNSWTASGNKSINLTLTYEAN